MFETLIVDGKVIDGAGRAWFRAAVGIEGDTVTVLEGDVSNVEAGRTIDASGMAVCPGFIDMHSHSDFALLASPRHEPKVSQGRDHRRRWDRTASPTHPSRPPTDSTSWTISPPSTDDRRKERRVDVGRVVPRPVRRRRRRAMSSTSCRMRRSASRRWGGRTVCRRTRSWRGCGRWPCRGCAMARSASPPASPTCRTSTATRMS